jgi:hypothetical protein
MTVQASRTLAAKLCELGGPGGGDIFYVNSADRNQKQ